MSIPRIRLENGIKTYRLFPVGGIKQACEIIVKKKPEDLSASYKRFRITLNPRNIWKEVDMQCSKALDFKDVSSVDSEILRTTENVFYKLAYKLKNISFDQELGTVVTQTLSNLKEVYKQLKSLILDEENYVEMDPQEYGLCQSRAQKLYAGTFPIIQARILKAILTLDKSATEKDWLEFHHLLSANSWHAPEFNNKLNMLGDDIQLSSGIPIDSESRIDTTDLEISPLELLEIAKRKLPNQVSNLFLKELADEYLRNHRWVDAQKTILEFANLNQVSAENIRERDDYYSYYLNLALLESLQTHSPSDHLLQILELFYTHTSSRDEANILIQMMLKNARRKKSLELFSSDFQYWSQLDLKKSFEKSNISYLEYFVKNEKLLKDLVSIYETLEGKSEVIAEREKFERNLRYIKSVRNWALDPSRVQTLERVGEDYILSTSLDINPEYSDISFDQAEKAILENNIPVARSLINKLLEDPDHKDKAISLLTVLAIKQIRKSILEPEFILDDEFMGIVLKSLEKETKDDPQNLSHLVNYLLLLHESTRSESIKKQWKEIATQRLDEVIDAAYLIAQRNLSRSTQSDNISEFALRHLKPETRNNQQLFLQLVSLESNFYGHALSDWLLE